MNRHILMLLILMIPIYSVDVGWLSEWGYRTEIAITNNAGRDLTNYQVKVSIDSENLISNNKMRGDCGDLRFTDDDGTTVIDYWLESGCNESSTVLWVKIPTLLTAEEKTIYAYYNAPTKISTSSGSSTFKLFDDFNSDSIGSTWQVYDGAGLKDSSNANVYINVINSSLVMNSVSNYNVITKNFRVSRPTIIEAEVLIEDAISTTNGKTFTVLYYDPETNFNPERSSYQIFTNSTGNSVINSSTSDSQTWGVSDPYSISDDIWYIQQMTLDTTNITSKLLSSAYVSLSELSIENSDINSKKVGLDNFDDGTSGNSMFVDWIRVREYANVTPSVVIGTEDAKPELSYTLEGSEAGNMRTLIYFPTSEEVPVKIELTPISQCELVDGDTADMGFGEFMFNKSGYAVNDSFRWINATNVSYSENCERVSVQYYNVIGSSKVWHIVQAYLNYPLIKHIIFVHTTEDISKFNESITLDSTCEAFVNTTGPHTCSSNMHSSGGRIDFSDASYCNVHWGTSTPSISESVPISDGYGKVIFWEALNKNCEPYLTDIELFCGLDYANCTASESAPIRIPFYNNVSLQKQLGRIEIDGDYDSIKVNSQVVENELIDTRYVSKGLNYIEIGGDGTISKIDLILSRSYTATEFFGEAPEIYKLTVKGPLNGVATKIKGIPVTDKILPFQKVKGNTHMDLGIGASTVSIDIFKTSQSFEFKDSKLYQISGILEKVTNSQLPLAASKDIQVPNLPPTHKIYSTSRLFYSNNIIAEMVITAWRAI